MLKNNSDSWGSFINKFEENDYEKRIKDLENEYEALNDYIIDKYQNSKKK